jgi:hypothetical protein
MAWAMNQTKKQLLSGTGKSSSARGWLAAVVVLATLAVIVSLVA